MKASIHASPGGEEDASPNCGVPVQEPRWMVLASIASQTSLFSVHSQTCRICTSLPIPRARGPKPCASGSTCFGPGISCQQWAVARRECSTPIFFLRSQSQPSGASESCPDCPGGLAQAESFLGLLGPRLPRYGRHDAPRVRDAVIGGPRGNGRPDAVSAIKHGGQLAPARQACAFLRASLVPA